MKYLLFLLLPVVAHAQNDIDDIALPHSPVDRSLLQYFTQGQFHAGFRYVFMSTINDGAGTDYYANAAGGSLSYETAPFHHFSAGVAAGYVFNIGSSDLTKPDPVSGQQNRYEIGLFDITNPADKFNMVRLDALYMKYSFGSSNIRFGKLGTITTPFINPEDGRMRPTVVEGLWGDIALGKHALLHGGWLYNIAPRSTFYWYKMENSIGLYPQGVTESGTKASYLNNLESAGVGILNFHYDGIKNLELTIENQYADNLFNTAFLQADYSRAINNDLLGISLQATKQDAINDGGNPDPSKTYFTKGAQSLVISGQVKWIHSTIELSLNATRITKDGRYLMPREWGRDPFFTFMPRERNEGFGNVTALVIRGKYQPQSKKWSVELSAGHFDLPDVMEFALNKYGMPSYNQYNLDLRYPFRGFLKGADAQLLLVYKQNAGDLHNNPKYEVNKVNMALINLVMNYRF